MRLTYQVTHRFREILKSMLDVGLLKDSKQAEICDEVLVQSLEHFENNADDLERTRREFSGAVAEAIVQQLDDTHQVSDTEIAKLVDDIQKEERFSFLMQPKVKLPVGITDPYEDDRLAPLLYTGVLRHIEGPWVTPLYPFSLFPLATLRIGHNQGEIQRFINTEYRGLRRIDANEIPRFFSYQHFWEMPEPKRRPLWRSLWRLAKQCSSHLLKTLGADSIKTAAQFYETAILLYSPSSKSIFIYARTPGLVIPEEYEGGPDNPHRKTYFDTLHQERVKKYYQWDRQSTVSAIAQRLEPFYDPATGKFDEPAIRDYRKACTGTLKRFTPDTNLHISEFDFSSAKVNWRDHFTLIGGTGMLFSLRGENRKIARGFYLDYNKLVLILLALGKVIDRISGSSVVGDVAFFLKILKELNALPIFMKRIHQPKGCAVVKDFGERIPVDEVVNQLFAAAQVEVAKKKLVPHQTDFDKFSSCGKL